MASATVSFGLVSIPVKLYSANQDSARIHFNMLHAACGSRLKQQYICPKEDVIVSQAETVKGYEFSKGRYVQFSSDEVKALEEKPTQSVDIVEFVPIDKVDLLYYDKAYFLGPDKGGDRAYSLLCKALHKTGRAALAKYAARGKQYLVLVRVVDIYLVMQQLHYAEEVKPLSEVPGVHKADVKPSELDLAVQLIEQRTRDSFHPEEYKDEVKERIEAAIARKVEGQEISVEPTEAPKAQIVDLMAALKASLGVPPEGPVPRKPAKGVGRKTAKSKSQAG